MTPKSAYSNGSTGSATGYQATARSHQLGGKDGKTPATPTNIRSDASQARLQQQAMPPPPRPQPLKISVTKPEHPAVPATQDSEDATGGPRQQSSSSSTGSIPPPAPRSTSSPRPATGPPKPPLDARPMADARLGADKPERSQAPPPRNGLDVLSAKKSVSSKISASSAESRTSTTSSGNADMRRYRVRDDDDPQDLIRRRSDSPEKNRPPMPQDRKQVIKKKSFVFGRFATGPRPKGAD